MRGPSESPARPARYSFVLKLDAATNDGTRPHATKIRDQVFAELKGEIGRLATEGIRPGLAALLVGEILLPTPMSKTRLPHATDLCRMKELSEGPKRIISESDRHKCSAWSVHCALPVEMGVLGILVRTSKR